jgi:hypothetical protein
VARKFGHVIDYLARVELEVDRNVLELLFLLPDVDETNKTFYADVWQPQEIQHGLILDRLQQDLGRAAAKPHLEVSFPIKILGALANLRPIQDIAKLMYFLTGASTERQAVIAYNKINQGMKELGETAISETIITPIKQQEPGHFAFYQMSATAKIQDKVLKPWQLFLTRVMREKSYHLVGTNQMKQYRADMGGVMADLGLDHDLAGYARDIGRVETRLLWAHKQGMEFPPYILKGTSGKCRPLSRATRARAQVRIVDTRDRFGRPRLDGEEPCVIMRDPTDLGKAESWRKLLGWPSLAGSEAYAQTS